MTRSRSLHSKRPSLRQFGVFGVVALLLLVAITFALPYLPFGPGSVAPAITFQPSYVPFDVETDVVNLAWPEDARAAIGTLDGGLYGTHGDAQQHPTASMAKIITALTVLDKYPLAADEAGPTITITQADVGRREAELARGGSNLPVSLGQEISLRQMLEGMLLPSANNLADTLAIWAFGSLADYVQAAGEYLSAHGIDDTTISPLDASGFDPGTTSTTADLFEIGRLAMKNDTLAAVVGTREMTWPGVEREVQNTNALLFGGEDGGEMSPASETIRPIELNGYLGIKTGTTPEAGAGLMFAKTYESNGHQTVLIGVVAGAESSLARFLIADALARSVEGNLNHEIVVAKGALVGHYTTDRAEWNVVAEADLAVWRWRDRPADIGVYMMDISLPVTAGQRVGAIWLGDGEVNAVLTE
jgi:D-alanyl-D-alanine carboxypeptidase (penicillin-binding protein 5/6)